MQQSIRRFFVFAAVGVAGTLVHYAILLLLVEFYAVNAVLSSGVGAFAGAIVNYFLNYRITFRSDGSHIVMSPKYMTIALSCFLGNIALMLVLVEIFDLDYRLSQLISTVLLLLWNYIASSCWVFASKKTIHCKRPV